VLPEGVHERLSNLVTASHDLAPIEYGCYSASSSIHYQNGARRIRTYDNVSVENRRKDVFGGGFCKNLDRINLAKETSCVNPTVY